MTRHAHGSGLMSHRSAKTMAQGLGWLSLALGTVEVLAPRAVSHTIGLRGQEALVRANGFREIATGIGILTTSQPGSWMWGRVGGDAIDLGTMAMRFARASRKRENLGVAMAAVAGVAALDLLCAMSLGNAKRGQRRRIYNYSDRSGFPASASAMRGAASDFEIPEDFRTPAALRPWDETKNARARAAPAEQQPRPAAPSLQTA